MAAPPAPPVGTVKVGELLVDAQTRALWLGVAATMTPAQAILVSDMLGLQDEIDALDASLRAYINQQIATRSPVGHTHPYSEITGTPPASAGGLAPACIVAWAGSVQDIPQGYALCDGTQGTPNLVGRFILAAGPSVGAHSWGGSWGLGGNTDAAPNHSHGASTWGHVLTTAQLPAHAHAVYDPGHDHAITDPGHDHPYLDTYPTGDPLPGHPYYFAFGGNFQQRGFDKNTGNARNWLDGGPGTGIFVHGKLTGIGIHNTGSGEAHAHTLNADGGHSHALAGGSAVPYYYTLAFIMKLPT